MKEFSRGDEFEPFISVIIPHFDDLERLKLCLQSLENQTYSKHRYEVIVVDNASLEDPARLLGQFAQARLAREERRGSYAARNRGLALARGEVIAFTDSDCIPASNWLATGAARLLKHPEAGLVAGRIEMFFQRPERPTIAEVYDSLHFLQQEMLVRDLHFGATANLFTTRQVIERVGSFDAALLSGGDQEWGRRVWRAGLPLIYAPEVCIRHPARYSLNELVRKAVRVTGGHCALQQAEGQTVAEALAELGRALLPPLRLFGRTLTDARLPAPSLKIKYLTATLIVKYATAGMRARALATRVARANPPDSSPRPPAQSPPSPMRQVRDFK